MSKKLSCQITELIMEKKFDEVEVLLKKIIYKYGDNSEILNILALLKYRKCKFNDAKNLFEKSYALNNNEQAREYLKRLFSDKDKYKNYYKALELCKNKKYEEAINYLEEYTPGSYNTIDNLVCMLYIKENKFVKAYKKYKSIVKGKKHQVNTILKYCKCKIYILICSIFIVLLIIFYIV